MIKTITMSLIIKNITKKLRHDQKLYYQLEKSCRSLLYNRVDFQNNLNINIKKDHLPKTLQKASNDIYLYLYNI